MYSLVVLYESATGSTHPWSSLPMVRRPCWASRAKQQTGQFRPIGASTRLARPRVEVRPEA